MELSTTVNNIPNTTTSTPLTLGCKNSLQGSKIVEIVDERNTESGIEYFVKWDTNTRTWITQTELSNRSDSKVLLMKHTRMQKLTQKVSVSNFIERANPLDVAKPSELVKSVNNKREQPGRRAKASAAALLELEQDYSDNEEHQLLPTDEDEYDDSKPLLEDGQELVSDDSSNDGIEGSENEVTTTSHSKKRKQKEEEEINSVEESEYEKKRRLQIEQNLLMAKQLGLASASQLGVFGEQKPKEPSPKKIKSPAKTEPSEPSRKSMRIRNIPIQQAEIEDQYKKLDEVSTEAFHPRMNKKMMNTNGSRVYDSLNGTTCHQCRQKTMDPKSICVNSNVEPSGKHKYCRTCLKNRYHEDLDEILKNPEWLCPNCKHSCNCSHCRKKR